MAYIESAFYGDEKEQRDTTKVLRDKVIGTDLDVDVNEQLIPPFEVVNKVTLSDKEIKDIKDDAAKACGGTDQDCIDKTEATLRQDRLSAKQKETSSGSKVIKGRRLTVNYIDENGDRKRLVIPDGQKFKLANVSVNDPKQGDTQMPSADYVQSQFKLLGMIVLSTLVYVFSVAATYTLFMQEKIGLLLAVPATAIAVFIPYSGYVIIFLYYMFNAAVNTYIGNI